MAASPTREHHMTVSARKLFESGPMQSSLSTVGLLDRLRKRYEKPQDRGRAFERLMLKAFERHPGMYGPARFKKVWLWADWPDRYVHGYSGPDVGIDLVAEQTDDYGGGLCAIQAKFHENQIAKADIDSFLSNAGRDIFDSMILVSTSELSSHARNSVSQMKAPRCEVLWGFDIEQWAGNWLEAVDDPEMLHIEPPERYKPHPFQQDAVHAVISGFDEHDRGKLILPCGTGKSVVALWAAEQIAGRGGRVLYLVPSIALMGQTMREWSEQGDPKIRHRYIGVCSDTRAGRNDEDMDMAELSIPVTTDWEKVSSSLSVEAGEPMTVVFSTYQSLGVVAEAQANGADAFDLVICDEAHRTTGLQGKGREASFFTLVHDKKVVRADRRLYMTATPKVYAAGEGAVGPNSRWVGMWSMDDEEVYGPEFYRMQFSDAVDGGYLSDYEVIVVAVSEQVGLSDGSSVDLGGDRVNTPEVVKIAGCWDALADPTTRTTADRKTGLRHPERSAKRAIAFTNTIRNSKRVEAFWQRVIDHVTPADASHEDYLQCTVKHVDGSKNALERARVINDLKEGDAEGVCRIVTNAKCLTEGVDVPALDAVLFLEPKKSHIDVVQAVGRVMRKYDGKEMGYVVIPVVVPEGGCISDEEVLSGSDFKQVWNVLKALRSHDSRLDVTINTADLAERPPITILPGAGVCPRCGTEGCDSTGCATKVDEVQIIQGRLPFEGAIASKVVEVCGDRQYWARWGKEVARITEIIEKRISRAVDHDPVLAAQFDQFTEDMGTTIGAPLARSELTSMFAQHIVTMPVFDALFSGNEFTSSNPISKALNELSGEFKSQDVRLEDETKDLERFYKSVENRLAGASGADARLSVMLEVYETFFVEAMPREVKRLGIVYTPLPIVDFILRSADAVLRKEFSRGLTSEGVHILDPFTGTGTFVNRLLAQSNSTGDMLIADEDLERKFTNSLREFGPGGSPHEIHANEIVLLAYYLAAIKIEEAYRDRVARYEPFDGIVLTDTFLQKPEQLPGMSSIQYNTKRAQHQDKLPIQVIVGNPPWSAGQKSTGDDNPNIGYPALEERVRATYGKRHREVTGLGAGKSAGNLYVQAIRWASDRLNTPDDNPNRPGVIAFVHPNSLSNGTSLAGMRAALRDEFTDIYVVNLLGDAMKSDEEREKEGQVIFGIEIRDKSEVRKGTGSRNGVQITVLVRNPDRPLHQPATLHYAEVSERSTLKQKFDWLAQLGDVTSDQFTEVPSNKSHHWVNLTDGSYQNLMRVCATSREPQDELLSHISAGGVMTACDPYVYAFNYDDLVYKVSAFIDAYDSALARVKSVQARVERAQTREERTEARLHLDAEFATVTSNTDQSLLVIKWTGKLKQALRRGDVIEFDASRIRQVQYRPFTKVWMYEDARILDKVEAVSSLFPEAPPPPEIHLRGSPEQQNHLRGHRHRLPHGPVLSRNEPTSKSDPPMEAITVSTPSPRTQLAILAHNTPPDFHLIDPAGRAVPRSRRS